MSKHIAIIVIISLILIAFYFIFSPYQNCKRDYVNEWLERENIKEKYISNLDREKREQFCITNSSW
tara:strand:+ start:77 stop:274 length:198 start_codon:yes stop_codon:yes gene_type:complete